MATSRKKQPEPEWFVQMQVRRQWITVYRHVHEDDANYNLDLRKRLLASVPWRVIHASKLESNNEQEKDRG